MSRVALLAPLAGWSTSLDEVPDAVFSARMLGDGLAIDPTGETLHAPCDGTVVTVAAQKHAITLRAVNGAEILLHVGIDTVALGGEGFELHVAPGQSVLAGAPLLSFDLDLLARRAKSLMTPIIVTDGTRFSVVRRSQDRLLAVGEFLFELQPIARAGAPEAAPLVADVGMSRSWVIPLEHGIHARPAAMLAACLKNMASTVSLEVNGRTVNARSPVAMMSLGVRKGDTVTFHARGADAAAALNALDAAIRDTSRHAGEDREPAKRGMAANRVEVRDNEIRGVIACRGLAAGRAVRLERAEIEVEEVGIGATEERAHLQRALEKVKVNLRGLADPNTGAQAGIVGAHLAFLEDPELLASANAWIERGKSAGYSWRATLRANIEALRASGDDRMAERVDDLFDLESQVLRAMADRAADTPPADLPERAILLAHDLLPSQLVALDASRLAGICVSTGGPTSHVAILAAAMDVPTLVAMGPAILAIKDGAALVVDADNGLLRLAPDEAQLLTAEEYTMARRARRSEEQAAGQRECSTADGVRIEMLANVGSVADARSASSQGAEGCGLLRTEFLFLDRDSAPTADEQLSHYREIVGAFAGKPVVIRTLDIGGDKPVAYIPLPREENPALGLRGIRVSLQQQELLREQLSAILRIDGGARCRILLPMINDARDIRAVRRIVDEVRLSLGRSESIPIGAMIETPAAALCAREIAGEADFLSIGTNDLTQYTLAIDRGHPQLSSQFEPRHPAVLRLIAAVVEAAGVARKPVAVCGGLASDPAAVPILIGLGIRELSAVPAAIPQLKALIATLTIQHCTTLAAAALDR